MADVNLNALVDGVSGKVGRLVMRQRGGRTFLATTPQHSIVASQKQLEFRERFLHAVRYAKSILLVPEVKAEYEKLGNDDTFMTPYTSAVKDYLTQPVISAIDTEGYIGKVGDKIMIRTPQDYKVLSAKVSLYAPDNTLIESGDAMSTHPVRLEWEYVATQNVADLAGHKLVVTVNDRPGNESTLEKSF